jgi:hypothetical protein
LQNSNQALCAVFAVLVLFFFFDDAEEFAGKINNQVQNLTIACLTFYFKPLRKDGAMVATFFAGRGKNDHAELRAEGMVEIT